MPPGDYTVRLSAGTVRFGELPAMPLPPLPPFQATLADQPVTVPLPVPFNLNISLLGSLTVTTTLDAGQTTIDPVTGAATADVTAHAVLKAVPGPFLNVTGTCTYASAAEPIQLHLATTADSVWKLPERAFTVYDSAFALPPPVCDDPTLQSLVVNAAGDTSAGHNALAITGTAARPEDAPPPDPPPPPLPVGGSAGGGSPGGSTPAPTGGNDPTPSADAGAPDAAPTATCVVPRLKGRTLASAKRLLTRAGCRLGKVSKRRSSHRRGTVLTQSKAPGRKVLRGTRVAVTLARR
jgi:hypothetical protein